MLYIDEKGKECDRGYNSKTIKREYTIHLYNEQNFPLKQNESDFWDKLCTLYKTNNVRNFFEKI